MLSFLHIFCLNSMTYIVRHFIFCNNFFFHFCISAIHFVRNNRIIRTQLESLFLDLQRSTSMLTILSLFMLYQVQLVDGFKLDVTYLSLISELPLRNSMIIFHFICYFLNIFFKLKNVYFWLCISIF